MRLLVPESNTSPVSPVPGCFVPQRGRAVGPWILERRLGAGAFGDTWLATGVDGEKVALKLLAGPPGDELRALTQVCHPGVVRCYSAGTLPVPHLVMAVAEGQSLDQWKLPVTESVWLDTSARIADAVASLHAAGVVHGDIKPSNIMSEATDPPEPTVVDVAGVASSGGTFAYAAPERLAGGPPTPESDVFALGVLLWTLLHGHEPWGQGAAAAAARRSAPPPVARIGSPWMCDLLLRALDPDPMLRAKAAWIADTLVAHGARTHRPDASLLAERSREVYVGRPEVSEQLLGVLDRGGHLLLVGPPGSGRSTCLRRVGIERAARGLPHIWLSDGVEAPELPAPADSTVPALVVLADGVDQLDDVARGRLSRFLSNPRVGVVASATTRVSGPWREVRLRPLRTEAIERFLGAWLGHTTHLRSMAAAAERVGATMPSTLRSFLLDAVRAGVINYRLYRWVVDSMALSDFTASWTPEREGGAAAPTRSPRSVSVLTALAIHPGPVAAEDLASIVEFNPATVRRELAVLARAGMVERGEQERWAATARGRAEPVEQTLGRALHRRWLKGLLEQGEAPCGVLARHLVGASDRALARRHGVTCLRELRREDPQLAAQAAAKLARLCEQPMIRFEHVSALHEAGRYEAAVEAADGVMREITDREVRAKTALLVAGLVGVHQHDEAGALAWLELLPEPRGQYQPAILEIRARMALVMGKHEQALRLALKDLPEQPPADEEHLDAWLGLRSVGAQAMYEMGQRDEALSLLADIDDDLGRGRAARALHDGAYGRLLLHAGRLAEAARFMALAAMPDSGVAALNRARLLNNAAALKYQLGDRAEAVARWEEALLLFERLGSRLEQVRVRTNLALGYREVGRWERARQAGEWAVEAAGQLERADYVAMAAGNLVDLHLAAESSGEAQHWCDLARGVAEEAHLHGELVELQRRDAEIAVRIGALDALDRAIEAVDAAHQAMDDLEASRACVLCALCYAEAGREQDAREVLDTALSNLARIGAAAHLAEARLIAAEAYLILGLHDEARELVFKADRFAREVGHLQLARKARELTRRLTPSGDPDRGTAPLEALVRLAGRAQGRRGAVERLNQLVTDVSEVVGAERAVLFDPKGKPVVSAGDAGRGAPSTSLVQRCIQLKREVLVADVSERGDLREARSVISLHLRSVACLPLVAGGDLLGVLYIDSRERVTEYSGGELAQLRLLAILVTEVLASVHSQQEVEWLRQELEDASGIRDAVLATVSHELRTPLTAILGQNQALLAADLPPRLAEAAKDVRDGAQRLSALIDDMLTYSNMSDAHPPRDEQFTPAALAQEIKDRFLPAAVEKGLGLFVEAHGDAERSHHGSGELLMDAVSRLVDNAVKFTVEGGVRVVFDAGSRGPGELDVYVSDTGPGFDVDDLATFMQPFTVAPDPRRRRKGGAGLGLAICRRVIDRLGGKFEVEGGPGEGTRITVKVGFELVDHALRGERPTDLPPPPERVLVVDDNEINLRVLARLLSRMGLEVDTATGGVDGFEAARSKRYLAVLTDWHMPDLDGLALTRQIRALDADHAWVPVVLVTADTTSGAEAWHGDVGIDSVIFKPLNPDKIRAAVEMARALWSGEAAEPV